MKKTMFLLTAIAASAMLYSGCAKPEISNGNETGNLVTVHFGTENTDPSTKATLTPKEEETAFQADWENEDKIAVKYTYVADNISEAVPGTWDASTSKFSAEIQDLTEGEEVLEMKYQASYPYSEDGYVDFGSARTQTGAAYNSIYDLMVAEPVTVTAKPGLDESGNAIVFPMQRQTAIAYFHFTSDNTEAITKATLKVEGEGAAIAAETVLLDPTGMDYETGLSEIVLTTTGQKADDFTLWFNVLPTTYTKMTLTVETATKTFTISKSTSGKYEAGKLYKVKKIGIAWTDKGGSVTPSTVTDIITADKLKATGTSYTDFSGVQISSKAVYAGQSAKSSEGGIQLRSKNSNSGIVTTVSGGKAKKISIVTESGTNTIDIYGKATPYTDATNLYATENGDQGTKLGSLKCGTDTELEIVGDYPYIGIRSNNSAIYLTSISITWETGSSEPAPDTYSVSCATVTGGTLSASPVKAEAGAEVTLIATPDKGYEFNNDWIVTNAETSETITVTGGKFTMPAADVNVTASFKQLSYAITANPSENGTYTVKVGEEEVASAVYGAKVLLEATPAEGYMCDGWTVLDEEGNSVTVSNNYFYMPASAVTISTSFSLKPEDITYDHAGTAEDPYSVADVLKYISTLGTETSTNDVYAKGVITSITEVNTSYGNATYKIKDEGVENEVLVYRGKYLNDTNFTSSDQISVGDEVVVKGKVKNHNNNTPEFVSGNSLVSILNVSASKTSIAAAGETVTITVKTNVDGWNATSDNAAFVVGTPSGNTIDVVVSKNTDASERTATITVTAGTLSKTITLTQSAAGAVTINKFSKTYSYGDLTAWSLTEYTDKSSYYLIPSGDNPSVATISGIFTDKTIQSDVVITLNIATFGSGTNPSASTFSIYADSDLNTSVTATQSGTLPTSSTYTNAVYTVKQDDAASLISDLAIKITKPGKQIRLKSIKIEFSYSE